MILLSHWFTKHTDGAAARDYPANQLFYVQGKDWMAIAGVAILFLV
jgi:hypothetical protein